MTIDTDTGAIRLAGLKIMPGMTLAHFRDSNPHQSDIPVISNDKWKTYRLVDSEAACHLMFNDESLWRVEIALLLAGDAEGAFSEQLERERHAAHEAFLLRKIGSTEWRCPNGSRIELCWDKREAASVILVTHEVGEPSRA